METFHGFDFQAIEIDRRGNLKSGAEDLARHVQAHGVSDVIIICHGFRNDANDARALYGRFLDTFGANRTRAGAPAALSGRTFAVGGIFWPSMVFPEPDDSQGGAQSFAHDDSELRLRAMKADLDPDEAAIVDRMLAKLPAARVDENAQLEMAAQLLELARRQPSDDGNEIQAAMSSASASPASLRNALLAGKPPVVATPGGGGGGAVGIPQLPTGVGVNAGGAQSFLGNVFGFVPTFLNLTTFLLMFNRCGDVGAKGISQVVRRVQVGSTARVHLVGHSLGGRAVTACAKALLDAPATKVDTMTLLQAAYSHFGLSEKGTIGAISHPRGFFRDVIEKRAVKGPILATHSTHDSVVGFAYTSMAAISQNNAKAFGDDKSPFGGIGRNGVLHTTESDKHDLNEAGVPYAFFKSGFVHNLDGSRAVSGKPLIGSHGDVTSAAITWAFCCLLGTSGASGPGAG